MKNVHLVEKYAPTLVFSKEEQYFPCNILFKGEDIVNNKQKYDKLSEEERKEKVCCYYHVNEGERYSVYQYWYYYAYNEYVIIDFLNFLKDNHEHDFECFKVFVDKETGAPKVITCNIHLFYETTQINGDIPKIKVEKGGHGLFIGNNRGWRWDQGYEIKIQPTDSCEELRGKMMPFIHRFIDTNLKLIGNDYDWFHIGKLAGLVCLASAIIYILIEVRQDTKVR